MPSGSCYCSAISVTYKKPILMHGLCHCRDCQKISGSLYSINIIVPHEGFEVKGTPKTRKDTALSGAEITSYFCGDCGTTVYRTSPTFAETAIIKAGVLDDRTMLEDLKPGVELFSQERVGWLMPVEGAAQKGHSLHD